MGAAIGRITKRARNPAILVLGLDNSGKTTVVNWLMKPAGYYAAAVVPSFGVNEQTVTANSLRMTMFDVAGLSLMITGIVGSCYSRQRCHHVSKTQNFASLVGIRRRYCERSFSLSVVCPSIRHIGDPYLNDSSYRNIFHTLLYIE